MHNDFSASLSSPEWIIKDLKAFYLRGVASELAAQRDRGDNVFLWAKPLTQCRHLAILESPIGTEMNHFLRLRLSKFQNN